MSKISFVPTKVDSDVWLMPPTIEGGFEYYEITCVYVDDMLRVSKDPKALIKSIEESY